MKHAMHCGRPNETTTFDVAPALAFGAAILETRTGLGIAQQSLVSLAGVELLQIGMIERVEHLSTLAVFLKIARALSCRAAPLIQAMETLLAREHLEKTKT